MTKLAWLSVAHLVSKYLAIIGVGIAVFKVSLLLGVLVTAAYVTYLVTAFFGEREAAKVEQKAIQELLSKFEVGGHC